MDLLLEAGIEIRGLVGGKSQLFFQFLHSILQFTIRGVSFRECLENIVSFLQMALSEIDLSEGFREQPVHGIPASND
jgi:hypothetical protein